MWGIGWLREGDRSETFLRLVSHSRPLSYERKQHSTMNTLSSMQRPISNNKCTTKLSFPCWEKLCLELCLTMPLVLYIFGRVLFKRIESAELQCLLNLLQKCLSTWFRNRYLNSDHLVISARRDNVNCLLQGSGKRLI